MKVTLDAVKLLSSILSRELGEFETNDPEMVKGHYSIANIKEIFRRKQILSRYGKKMVISDYYTIVGNDPSTKTYLTKEEFRAGKAGYFLVNYRHGQI